MKLKFIPAMIALSLSLQAQFQPVDRFLYQTFWPNLPKHDSITLWYDSIDPAGLYGSYRMNLNNAGLVDTMVHQDLYSQEDVTFYSGKTVGQVHAVASFYHDENGVLVPSERVTFVLNTSGMVEEIYSAFFDGDLYQENLKYEITYRSDLSVEGILVKASYGSSYSPVSRYSYYYSGSLLDSVVFTYLHFAIKARRYEMLYDQNGRMEGMDVYERLGMTSGLDTSRRYLFRYDMPTKFRYVDESYYNYASSAFDMNQVFEYSQRKQPAVRLPEYQPLSVKVFPNPVTDYLNIEGDDLIKYELYNQNGGLVMQGEITPGVDVSWLKKGVYLLRVYDLSGNGAKVKIVKR